MPMRGEIDVKIGFEPMKNIECSFCGKSVPGEEAKGQFVAGPKAFICWDCVDLTVEIFCKKDPQWGNRTIVTLQAMRNTT
jgi:ATP-dependent protease Clp ATPase subunit